MCVFSVPVVPELIFSYSVFGHTSFPTKRNVWSIVLITEIPNGRKPIGNKWVLKIKIDERYRARLVCLGYTQIPGIDFQGNSAPVVNDTTFQTVLTLAALYDWDLAILDVKKAFLYRDLKEDIYMDLPTEFFSLDENISKVTDILKD